MNVIQPGKGRAVIENHDAGLRITVTAGPPSWAVGFLSVWALLWFMSEVVLFIQLLRGKLELNDVWIFLLFWTLGGIWVVYCLLWAYAGKEIIEVSSQFLKYRWHVPIFGYSRVYAIANATNLRITPYNQFDLYFPRFLPFSFYKDRHALSFDYGRKKHLLGISFDEADAKLVMGELCKRVNSLGAGRNDVEEEVEAS